MQFRPMLAATAEDVARVVFPKLVSGKIDGLRCCIRDGAAFSRNLKPVANDYIRGMLQGLPNFDGELIVGNGNDPNLWNQTVSGVRTKSGEPEFVLAIFDISDDFNQGFSDRLRRAEDEIAAAVSRRPELRSRLALVPHVEVRTLDQLMEQEDLWVGRGYEGVMLRSPHGPYKLGRSTEHEQYLMKLKRWKDTEAVIEGFQEEQANLNEATISELGLTKRSTHKENKKGKDRLGAFIVRVPGKPKTTKIGSGYTEAQRIDFWNRREELLGQTVSFKYFEMSEEGVARFPVFMRFYNED
jgi:DNA ligase-1